MRQPRSKVRWWLLGVVGVVSAGCFYLLFPGEDTWRVHGRKLFAWATVSGMFALVAFTYEIIPQATHRWVTIAWFALAAMTATVVSGCFWANRVLPTEDGSDPLMLGLCAVAGALAGLAWWCLWCSVRELRDPRIRKAAQPGAPPKDGPGPPLGKSDTSGGRHR